MRAEEGEPGNEANESLCSLSVIKEEPGGQSCKDIDNSLPTAVVVACICSRLGVITSE